jgi:hypothetical protein
MSDQEQDTRFRVAHPKKDGPKQVNSKRRLVKVAFGTAIVKGARPSRVTVEENIKLSNSAMEQVVKWAFKPGVRTRRGKGVPYYSASSDEDGVIIRRIDGKIERGRFVNGTFRAFE